MSAAVLHDPAAELERAVSDYLAVSRNSDIYATHADYETPSGAPGTACRPPARRSRPRRPRGSPSGAGAPQRGRAGQPRHLSPSPHGPAVLG